MSDSFQSMWPPRPQFHARLPVGCDSTQMLLGESTCSFRAGFERRDRESLEIGRAVNISPLIEQRHLQPLRFGRIKRLGEYAVRAPIDSAKECRMRTVHPDK